MKKIITIICITILLITNTLIGLFTINKLSVYFGHGNTQIINYALKQYSDLLFVEKNSEKELVFYIYEYWYDNFETDEGGTLFDPRDCIEIMKNVEPMIENEDMKLSFHFSNGTIITFKDYGDNKFNTVEINNSNARGFIIPNISYYVDYTCFSRYEFFGAFHDHNRYDEEFGEGDKSILEYAGSNATIVIDEYTHDEIYNRYYKQDLQFDTFGELIMFYCNTQDNIIIEPTTLSYDRENPNIPHYPFVPVTTIDKETGEVAGAVYRTSLSPYEGELQHIWLPEGVVSLDPHQYEHAPNKYDSRTELLIKVAISIGIEIILLVGIVVVIRRPQTKKV